jgi:hypothetical protein
VIAGRQFAKDHPEAADNDFAMVSSGDELSVLSVGNPMGRACRVVGLKAPAPMYDRPADHAPITRRINNGDLLVVFDDPGKFRQVIASDQTFGYIPYSVKLEKTNLFPNEVFGMQTPPPTPAATPAASVQVAPTAAPPSASTTKPTPPTDPIKMGGLTAKQLAIAAMLFVGVFGAMIFGMMQFAGR